MPERQDKQYKNAFTIRIVDSDVLLLFTELLKTKMFASANELINQCVAAGITNVYKKTFGTNPLIDQANEPENTKKNTALDRELKQMNLTLDDIFNENLKHNKK